MSVPKNMQTPSDSGAEMGTVVLSPAAHQAIARGSVYRMVAQGFRAPNDDWLAKLEDACRDVVAIEIAEAWQTPEDASLVDAIEESLGTIPNIESLDELSDLYFRLFSHTVAGRCPLYETEYGEWAAFQQPHMLADLTGTYRAFGLVLSEVVKERPDHLSLECEFLYVLSHKEAWAHQHNGPEEVAVCVDARRLFLSEHLVQWAPSLANRLASHAPDTFYCRLGELLVRLLDHECRTLGVRMGEKELVIGTTDLPADDGCGACSDSAECSVPPQMEHESGAGA